MRAVAAPRPDAPPVTMNVLPSMFMFASLCRTSVRRFAHSMI
jgi:hypothetical protein